MRVSIVIGLGLLLVASSHAATIVIFDTHDISGFSTSFATNFDSDPLDNGTVNYAVGDIIDLTVTFTPGLALEIADGGESINAWMGSLGQSHNFTIANAQLEFLGFVGTGGAPDTLFLASQSSGSAHIGPAFSNFLSAGQSLQATGYHVTYEITALTVDPNSAASSLLFSGNSRQVAAAVPEPGSLALLGLLGLLGVRRRRPSSAA